MSGSFAYGPSGKFYDHEVDPSTAQFVLFSSMQKLDQARRSRGGIRLHQGLLIAVTALKARQLLWQQSNYFQNPLQIDPVKLMPTASPPQPLNTPTQSVLPVDVPMTTSNDSVLPPCETVGSIANPVWPPLSTEDYFSFPKINNKQEMNSKYEETADDPNDDSNCPLNSVRNLCFASDPVNCTDTSESHYANSLFEAFKLSMLP